VKAEHLYNPRFYEIFTKYETAVRNIEKVHLCIVDFADFREFPCGAVVKIKILKSKELKIIENYI
jgi:hypothetical protein